MILLSSLIGCHAPPAPAEPPGSDVVSEPEVTAEGSDPTTPVAPTNDGTSWTPPDLSPRPPTEPPVACPVPPDVERISDCAASTAAAYVGEVGYASIQDAIAAAEGAEVVVCPGVWPPGLTLVDGALVAADPTPGATVIEGSWLDPLLDVSSSTVRGITFRRGHGGRRGAITASGDVVLECVTVDECSAETGAGGVLSRDGTLVVRWSGFGANVVGGVEDGGGAIGAERLVVEDSRFAFNFAGYGGAIRGEGETTIRRSVFEDNDASNGGAAVAFDYGPVTIEDSHFEGNVAAWRAGGVYQIWHDPAPDARITLARSTFSRNAAGGWGGAVFAADAAIEDCTFVENSAGSGGGALELTNEIGLAATITRTTFRGNESGDSAAIEISGGVSAVPGTLLLEDLTIEDGTSTGDAGALRVIHQADLAVTATGLTVRRNVSATAAVVLEGAGHTFVCSGCDFGEGADDNTPADASVGGVPMALSADFSLGYEVP